MLITCDLKCGNSSVQTQKHALALSPGEMHSKAAYGTSKVRLLLLKVHPHKHTYIWHHHYMKCKLTAWRSSYRTENICVHMRVLDSYGINAGRQAAAHIYSEDCWRASMRWDDILPLTLPCLGADLFNVAYVCVCLLAVSAICLNLRLGTRTG